MAVIWIFLVRVWTEYGQIKYTPWYHSFTFWWWLILLSRNPKCSFDFSVIFLLHVRTDLLPSSFSRSHVYTIPNVFKCFIFQRFGRLWTTTFVTVKNHLNNKSLNILAIYSAYISRIEKVLKKNTRRKNLCFPRTLFGLFHKKNPSVMFLKKIQFTLKFIYHK